MDGNMLGYNITGCCYFSPPMQPRLISEADRSIKFGWKIMTTNLFSSEKHTLMNPAQFCACIVNSISFCH